jgi:hypothetical protein
MSQDDIPARLPSLEIHIPISANDLFLNMTHYLVRSLRQFGGPYANARVIVTIGEPEVEADIASAVPWLKNLGIEVRWVPPEKYAQDSYWATAAERFLHPFESDMVLMLDADILIAAPFTDLVQGLHARQSFGGFTAHIAPFPQFDYWQRTFDLCGLGQVKATNEHTGWGYMFSDDSLRYCPPYFNLGVLCAPANIMSCIGTVIYDLMHQVNTIHETVYRLQIAVTLALEKFDIPSEVIAARYNFPNLWQFEAMYPYEWPNASIIHILGEHQGVRKSTVFASPDDIARFLTRTDLRCINARIQEVLQVIHPLVLRDREGMELPPRPVRVESPPAAIIETIPQIVPRKGTIAWVRFKLRPLRRFASGLRRRLFA